MGRINDDTPVHNSYNAPQRGTAIAPVLRHAYVEKSHVPYIFILPAFFPFIEMLTLDTMPKVD